MSKQWYYDKYKRNQASRKFYLSKAWVKCRALVLQRDSYMCQDCYKDKKLTQADMVHHIEEYADNPDRGLDMDNLVSLCNSCHNKRHKKAHNLDQNLTFDGDGNLIRKI
ncbi:HNH endonuclease [Bacillus subtilis]|uniref:HNH endonuclease n=1 Tax=Bacillus subtilis TaxID=1423 RepID=UPI0039B6E0D8